MKKTLKLLAMAFIAGAMFTACGGDDNDKGGGNEPPPVGGEFPPVTITNELKGAVKAGLADAIEIIGEGFHPEEDYIYVGYENGAEITYERVKTDVLTLKAGRVAFGVRIDAAYIDKTVKVYLDRVPFEKMPITGDITFTMPTVAEGYIPDPAFRAALQDNHRSPNIIPLFDAYGMLDVAAAGKLTSSGSKDNWKFDLSGCAATSLEGIELFKNIGGDVSGTDGVVVAAWGMDNIVTIDLSKWTAKRIDFRTGDNGVAKLEKFIGAPYMYGFQLQNSPNLTYVDCSKSRWLYWANIWNSGEPGTTNVTFLDIRRDMNGAWADRPIDVNQYTFFNGNSYFKVADNAEIRIDTWFLFDHCVDNQGAPSCWANIYNAWKRGATIKVYSWKDIEQLIGTAPMYSEDPNALSPLNKKGDYQPANNWQIDDPNTSENEAPVPYVPPGK